MLPVVEIRHELPTTDRHCPACGGELIAMSDQAEISERIRTMKLTYQIEHHLRQKYRCRCRGHDRAGAGPGAARQSVCPQVWRRRRSRGVRRSPALERQVRMMGREGLTVESQTLWDQINAIAHHLEPV